jgi:predicted phage-related endonuclease
MAELIGTIAAGIQVAEVFLILSKELNRCVRTIHNAPEEIRRFQRDTFIFSNNLHEFHNLASDILEEVDPQSPDMRRMARTVRAIIKQSEGVKKGIEKLLEKFRRGVGFLDRLKWYFQNGRVSVLGGTLNCVKLDMMIVIALFQSKILQRQIDKLKKEKKDIPQRLKNRMFVVSSFVVREMFLS